MQHSGWAKVQVGQSLGLLDLLNEPWKRNTHLIKPAEGLGRWFNHGPKEEVDSPESM